MLKKTGSGTNKVKVTPQKFPEYAMNKKENQIDATEQENIVPGNINGCYCMLWHWEHLCVMTQGTAV